MVVAAEAFSWVLPLLGGVEIGAEDAPVPGRLLTSMGHALADVAFDHRGPERASAESDEALVHSGGAVGQVGTEPHPGRVRGPHTDGDDVS